MYDFATKRTLWRVTFADRLKTLRLNNHLTQRRLSEIADISKNTLKGYENARHEPPGYVVVKLVEALGVSTDELLGVGDE